MRGNDHVDPRDIARELHRVGCADVRRDDDDVGLPLHFGEQRSDRVGDRPELQAGDGGRLDDRRRTGIRETDDPNPRDAEVPHLVRFEICRSDASLRLDHVRREEWEARVLGTLREHVLPPVEVVISHREPVVVHEVHCLRDRFALVGVRDERALPGVAGVDEQGPLRCPRPERRDLSRELRHATGSEAGARVRARHEVRVEVAVDVVGVQQLDPVVRERACRWRRPDGRRAGRSDGQQQPEKNAEHGKNAKHGGDANVGRCCAGSWP